MHSVEFCQHALQNHVAPKTLGNVKARLVHATRELLKQNERNRKRDLPQSWTPNRVKDAWYADPRISLSVDEIRDLEEITGLRYGRKELKEIDRLIGTADALLDGQPPHFRGAFIAAMRALASALDRTGTEG